MVQASGVYGKAVVAAGQQTSSKNFQSSLSFVVCSTHPTVEELGHVVISTSGEKGDAYLETEYGIENFQNFPGVKFLKRFQQKEEEGGEKEKMIFVQVVPKGGFHCFKPFCQLEPKEKIIFTLSLYRKF